MDIFIAIYKNVEGWCHSLGNIKTGILLSCIMSLLRGLYFHHPIYEVIMEGAICGFLTMVSVSGMSYFGIGDGLSIAIGGFIGFVGVRKISTWIDRVVNKRIDA